MLASEISENRFLFHKELGLFHAGERHYFLLLFLNENGPLSLSCFSLVLVVTLEQNDGISIFYKKDRGPGLSKNPHP